MIEASSLYIFSCSSLLHITAANGARLALVAHIAHFTFNISATKNYLSEIIEPSLTTHFSRHHFTFAMYSVSVALLVSVYVCRGFGGWGW